jgi:hypothetical protein
MTPNLTLSSLQEPAESLQVDVFGPPPPSCAEAMTSFADAFGETAEVHPIDPGAGLRAVLRTSADGSSRVLCVHNIAEQPASFILSSVLPTLPGTSIHFLRGEVRTEGTGTQVTDCHLAAGAFVWFGQR